MRTSGLTLLVLLLLTNVATAQQQVDVTGTIVGLEGTVILIRDMVSDKVFRCDLARSFRHPTENVNYILREPPSVDVTGTEDAKNLRPGLFIQFQVVLSGKKNAVGEVTAATLITPGPEGRLGILNAEAIEAPEPAEGDKKPKPQNLEQCLVAGSITKARNGSLTVAFPGERGPTSIIVRLADDAKIDVSGNNLSLARIGDKIHATGTGWVLPHFLATEIKVEHSPAIDEKLARNKVAPKDDDKPQKGKPGDKKKPAEFGVGDPSDEKPMVPAPAKPKVKLEILKVN